MNTSNNAAQASAALTHEEIEELAYEYWQQRGDAPGSAEDDWWRAEQDLHAVRETPQPQDLLETL